jgi:hypothetical protein
MSRATFEEVYAGRMEKYVEPSRQPLIESLVADQIAGIRVITKILEVMESTDDIDCYMKKPDISCSPRCIMEGGGIIYKTRDNIPHSVVTNSGIINFTRGFHYTNNALKVLHEKLTTIFSLNKFHTTFSGNFGVTYTYDWYNITRTDFGNERLNFDLTIDNFTYTKTRQEIISDQERKAVEAGALIEVGGLISPFAFQFNKKV